MKKTEKEKQRKEVQRLVQEYSNLRTVACERTGIAIGVYNCHTASQRKWYKIVRLLLALMLIGSLLLALLIAFLRADYYDRLGFIAIVISFTTLFGVLSLLAYGGLLCRFCYPMDEEFLPFDDEKAIELLKAEIKKLTEVLEAPDEEYC